MFLCLSRFECIHHTSLYISGFVFLFFGVTRTCLLIQKIVYGFCSVCFSKGNKGKGNHNRIFLGLSCLLNYRSKAFQRTQGDNKYTSKFCPLVSSPTALQAIPEHSLTFKVWLTELERRDILQLCAKLSLANRQNIEPGGNI